MKIMVFMSDNEGVSVNEFVFPFVRLGGDIDAAIKREVSDLLLSVGGLAAEQSGFPFAGRGSDAGQNRLNQRNRLEQKIEITVITSHLYCTLKQECVVPFVEDGSAVHAEIIKKVGEFVLSLDELASAGQAGRPKVLLAA